MKKYANAKDVLPAELLQEVRKFCTGNLYIPPGNHCREKRTLVMRLHGQQSDAKSIASVTGLSPRRVFQIIAEERDKTRSDAPPTRKGK